MKIISKHLDHLVLNKGQCNFLYMKNSYKEYELRHQIKKWISNKLDEDELFYFLDEAHELTMKDVELLELHGGHVESVSNKLLHQWLKYQLQNDANAYEELQTLQNALESFCLASTFSINNIEIELLVPEQIAEAILKVCAIEMSSEANFTSIANVQLSLELWKGIVFSSKPKVIFYYYPECDGAAGEVITFLESLEEQGITTICFTKSETILKQFPLNQAYLVKESGSFYDIQELAGQFAAFMPERGVDATVILELAFRDFMGQFDLLDEKYKAFLLSSRF